MYPSSLDTATASAAERRMYRELRDQLPPEFTVLHSVAWVTLKQDRLSDGETDFVIAHPHLGILILEVKGGEIRRDGASGRWTSGDAGGHTWEIKDPFEQAKRARYALERKLGEFPAAAKCSYPLARAVAFPDTLVGPGDLGPDMPRELIIDSKQMATLQPAIRLMMPSRNGEGPGADGVRTLINLLRPDVALTRRGLLSAILDEKAEMLRLTEQQFALLDALVTHRRVAVNGVAGSGKTILALEQVRRLAMQGYRVLFTCYNKALAGFARRRLGELLGPHMANVVVDHYHDLATETCRAAGYAVPENATAPAAYFETELPDRFLAAIPALPDRFDAIVVDEGQDFADVWWVTLEELLRDPKNSALYIFYDQDQVIYRNRGAFPIPEPHFQLLHNCRSTRAIQVAAGAYTPNPDRGESRGPAGRPIEFIESPEQSALVALRRVIHRLRVEEGISLSDIVVLTPRSMRTSQFAEGAKVGNLTLSWDPEQADTVACRTIHSFKGLESPIVILAELDRAYPDSRNAVIYVAMTRACNHLIVLGDLPPPNTRLT